MGFAIAAGAAALGGAYLQSQAAQNAADTQSKSADRANATQWGIFNQQRADQAPWRQAGQTALSSLQNQMPDLTRKFSMSDYQADPGFNFRLQQGQQAIERSAAARGGLNSGATLKSLTDYSQGAASQEYQNAYNRFNNDQSNTFNRLASVAGLGQTANAQLGAAGQNTANQVGQNIVGAGNAQAAGQIGQANAINGAIGTGTNTWMQQQMLNRFAPQAQSTPGTTSLSSYGGYGQSSPAPGTGYLGTQTDLSGLY